MRFRDQWRFVRKNAAKNKSRLFMTVLATAMGCAFLIVLASVGFGIQESVVGDLTEGRVLNEIAVRGKRSQNRYQTIATEDIEFMAAIARVRAVTREQTLGQQPAFRWGEIEGPWSVLVAVDFPSEDRAGMELVAGRLPERTDEVLVGHHFVQLLHAALAESEAGMEVGALASIGQSITPSAGTGIDLDEITVESLVDTVLHVRIRQSVDGEWEEQWFPLTITGVMAAPDAEWLRDQRILISEALLTDIEAFTQTPLGQVIPPDTPSTGGPDGTDLREVLRARFESGVRSYDNVIVHARNVEDVKSIVEALSEAGYANYSIVHQLDRVNTIFVVIRAGLVLVGMIAVIIASIGIYNTMTMAVTERSQDIGIMKAIGAHPSAIKRVFLIESTYIGVLGAMIGVLISFVASAAVNTFLPMILESALNIPAADLDGIRFSSIPGGLILLSVTLAIGVAIISGLRPATRATRIDVLQALRRDL